MTARIEQLAKLIPQAMDFGGTAEQVISSSVYGYNFTYFVLQNIQQEQLEDFTE